MIKILLVEDEKETADGIARLLNRKGFDVDVAYDLASAMESNFPSYQLILLDILLKDEKSFPLLEKVKREFPEVLVMIVSAYDNDQNIIEAKRLGADEIITKPLIIEQLESFILSKVKPVAKESN
ncbi:MAG: response regulator [Candidatus Omnitrophota bacterium]|jgi:DNA-binding response OmpR family regulator